MLAQLEARAGEPLGRRFDLIAGTSVGGILAIALAYEIPMRAVQTLIAERGSAVFSPRPLPSGTMSRLIDATRGMFGPKYDPQPLRGAIGALLGERRLGEAAHNRVIPAVDLTRGVTKVFKTPHAAGSTGDEQVAALDVAMATSAAPAYFPAVQVGGRSQAAGDGGGDAGGDLACDARAVRVAGASRAPARPRSRARARQLLTSGRRKLQRV